MAEEIVTIVDVEEPEGRALEEKLRDQIAELSTALAASTEKARQNGQWARCEQDKREELERELEQLRRRQLELLAQVNASAEENAKLRSQLLGGVKVPFLKVVQ